MALSTAGSAPQTVQKLNTYVVFTLTPPHLPSLPVLYLTRIISSVQVLAKLEGGVGALVYGSGMAAISSTFMCFFRPGDHIIAQSPNYSGTHTLLTKYLPSYGVEVCDGPSHTAPDPHRITIKSLYFCQSFVTISISPAVEFVILLFQYLIVFLRSQQCPYQRR